MGNTQSADDGDGGSEHASYGDSVFFGSYSSPNRALPPSDSSSSSKKEGGQQRVEQRASSPPITTPDPPADESSLDHVNSHDNLLRASRSSSFPGCFLASSGWIRGPPATAEPLARPRPQKKTNHRNHQPHHSTHQPRPAALGWEPSHPDRLIRSPTDQKDRLSTRTHLFRPPRRAAGCACRAARLGCGSGSCTRNRAGCGPVVGSWLGFAP